MTSSHDKPHDGNGWNEYEKLVMFRLDKIDERLEKLESSIIGLKVKAASWGAGMALVVWIGSVFIPQLVRKLIGG